MKNENEEERSAVTYWSMFGVNIVSETLRWD